MLRIIDNPIDEVREEAEKKLCAQNEKFGKRYCPCSLVTNESTVCPCKEFREQDFIGDCHCGRYTKVEYMAD